MDAPRVETLMVDAPRVDTCRVELTNPVLVVTVEMASVDAMREDPVSVENWEGVYPGMKMVDA